MHHGHATTLEFLPQICDVILADYASVQVVGFLMQRLKCSYMIYTTSIH